ncbi:ABC transporter permease [Ensifer sp. ENS07]|jgi:ribose/xylose/arabinose/galactoside ABC-type transport system permease subunit|uniref:ABC transporter permease n=1 Tax=Ensifer adhaerens TaxID=106592 RepID=A0A9Q8YHB9_ENSAD|nr:MULTISPECIES: ABC transporter permease [Ensifer]OWZ88876.1 sugar ABC transporter permease [Sinorhizobium sp. LM21]ANK77235.1 sugar ABC transporter permease [Ensifer adhaerens]KDP71225.1 sugar ABC transporter permease [Ensifer adhaerens]MBD9544932.1 ABC transporter permease [Ensifer sp. ENS04]MBD9561345.1 ABC transporter permease [Ensifer sp. ENS03]
MQPILRLFLVKNSGDLARFGVILALAGLILFGALRYENFLSPYNILSFLRYNSMFALIALGMAFVIITGGIDLSVGGTAAMASVVAALLSPYHWAAGLAGGMAAGLAVGALNGFIITKMRIQPFIATLATMLAAYGTGLLLADNQSVSVSYDTGFTVIGQDDFLGFPIPAWIALAAYVLGWLVLQKLPIGRHILAIGDGEATAGLMGLKVERALAGVYLASGTLAGLAGVILASQFGAGQPTEGVGWELFAIASVVVGGTLLTGGSGSVGATLAGALLLAMVFNILNFENGLGWISLSAYWQSVIRGAFLLVVVVLQAKLMARHRST